MDKEEILNNKKEIEKTGSLVPNSEMDVYFVRSNEKGYFIQLENPKVLEEKEFIFGLGLHTDPPEKLDKNKAWLYYWCMRLNRAYVNGWGASQGISTWPDKNYYEELDRLYKKMTT